MEEVLPQQGASKGEKAPDFKENYSVENHKWHAARAGDPSVHQNSVSAIAPCSPSPAVDAGRSHVGFRCVVRVNQDGALPLKFLLTKHPSRTLTPQETQP